LLQLFTKYINHPAPDSLDPDEKDAFEEQQRNRIQAVSTAFTHYMAMTGPFSDWPTNEANFEKIHVRIEIPRLYFCSH
jgi:hypothetical protein